MASRPDDIGSLLPSHVAVTFVVTPGLQGVFAQHLARVAAFRQRARDLDSAIRFHTLRAQILTGVEWEQLKWMFERYAPVEIVLGRALTRPERVARARAAVARKSSNHDKRDAIFYFTRAGDLGGAELDLRFIVEQGGPPRIALPQGPYSAESTAQMVTRRMREGRYLFGGIGGLMGGAMFTLQRARGVEFDEAVQSGAVMAAVGDLLPAPGQHSISDPVAGPRASYHQPNLPKPRRGGWHDPAPKPTEFHLERIPISPHKGIQRYLGEARVIMKGRPRGPSSTRELLGPLEIFVYPSVPRNPAAPSLRQILGP